MRGDLIMASDKTMSFKVEKEKRIPNDNFKIATIKLNMVVIIIILFSFIFLLLY